MTRIDKIEVYAALSCISLAVAKNRAVLGLEGFINGIFIPTILVFMGLVYFGYMIRHIFWE